MSAVLSSDFARHVPLSELRKGESAVVVGLEQVQGAELEAMRTRLLELGFAPGEKVRVVAMSFPNRDPIAVRVGNTTFALRRHEAALIQVSFHSPVQGEIQPVLS
jgi:ferrous iron transport protein A